MSSFNNNFFKTNSYAYSMTSPHFTLYVILIIFIAGLYCTCATFCRFKTLKYIIGVVILVLLLPLFIIPYHWDYYQNKQILRLENFYKYAGWTGGILCPFTFLLLIYQHIVKRYKDRIYDSLNVQKNLRERIHYRFIFNPTMEVNSDNAINELKKAVTKYVQKESKEIQYNTPQNLDNTRGAYKIVSL